MEASVKGGAERGNLIRRVRPERNLNSKET